MFWLKGLGKKRRTDEKTGSPHSSVPVITVTLEQVRRAVQEYERGLPKGVNRTVLIRENNEIDFRPLVIYLKGMPDRPFYMSREAYEIYEEEDRLIPFWLDVVQQAVDDYIREWKELPVVPDDSYRKISFALLEKCYYLKEKPPLDFYLTPYENLISHRPVSPRQK